MKGHHQKKLEATLQAVVKWAVNASMSRLEIIQRAGLNRGVLDSIGREDFNPSLRTLRGILSVKPRSEKQIEALNDLIEWIKTSGERPADIARQTTLTSWSLSRRKNPDWNPAYSTILQIARARDVLAPDQPTPTKGTAQDDEENLDR